MLEQPQLTQIVDRVLAQSGGTGFGLLVHAADGWHHCELGDAESGPLAAALEAATATSELHRADAFVCVLPTSELAGLAAAAGSVAVAAPPGEMLVIAQSAGGAQVCGASTAGVFAAAEGALEPLRARLTALLLPPSERS